MRSDVTGSNLNTIISSSQLFGSHVTDIDWFEDVLYLVLNSSRVYMYHTTEKKLTRYSDLESVGSIAVDWLGRKLYWASPNQQLVRHKHFVVLHLKLNIDFVSKQSESLS